MNLPDELKHCFRGPTTKVDCFIFSDVDNLDIDYYLHRLQNALNEENIATQVMVYDDPKTPAFPNTYGIQHCFTCTEVPKPFHKNCLATQDFLAVRITELPRLTYDQLAELIVKSLRYKTPNVRGLPSTILFEYIKSS